MTDRPESQPEFDQPQSLSWRTRYTAALIKILHKTIDPEHPRGAFRSDLRKAITELKNVLELQALSAATIAAGILTESGLLKQGGILISILAMFYFTLLFPSSVSHQENRHYAALNIAYMLARVALILGAVYVFGEWVGRLTESAIGLVFGVLPPKAN